MKLKKLQSYLKKENIDLAVLADQDINITYFTQIKPSFAFLMVSRNSASLFLTPLDKIPKIKGIKVKTIQKNWDKNLPENVKKIGLNYASITMDYSKFVDISKKLNELRSTKTKEEIKLIQKACQITDYAFSELIKELKKKKLKTELDVATFIESKYKEKNAEVAFPTIAAMGKNAAIPHHVTSNQKLKRGFLLLDFGAKYKNYCADMSRTIFLGTPNNSEVEMYNLLLNSQKIAIKEVKKDMLFDNLDQTVRTKLGKYSSHFIHSLGHGLGLDVHESPSYFKELKNKVKSGHVFTIEPGIYFPKKFGIRIEDTLVFDGKVKILTKSDKKLIYIDI